MRTSILVSGVVLLGVLAGGAGYAAGVYETPQLPASYGAAAPLGALPMPDQLPRKIPQPSTIPALKSTGLSFRERNFSVQPEGQPRVQLSIRMPRGWQLTTAPDNPQEVKFLDPLKERGVRVKSGFPPDLTTTESRDRLVKNLRASLAYEDDLRILTETDDTVEADGGPRTVSTVTYTYIPNKTRRYVIVRWVATGGDDHATVEMSVTGLPQDAAGLAVVLLQATRSVRQTG